MIENQAGRVDGERPYRCYVIAGTCFLTIFTVLGLDNMPSGQYVVPVTTDLGFARMDFSLMFSARFAISTVLGMLWAKIISLLGVRKMTALGVFSLALYFLCERSAGRLRLESSKGAEEIS